MSALAEAIAEVLRDEGYRPTVNGEDVSFRAEGTLFGYETFGEDTGYARLVLGYALPDETPIEAALAAANDRNVSAKAVKTAVYPATNNVLFTVEQFFDEPERLRPVFQRALSAVQNVSDQFFEMLAKADDDASAETET